MAEQWKKLPAAEKQKYVERAKELSEAQNIMEFQQQQQQQQQQSLSTPQQQQQISTQISFADMAVEQQPQQVISVVPQQVVPPYSTSFFQPIPFQQIDLQQQQQSQQQYYFQSTSPTTGGINSSDFFS
jgi:hypothetical protein